MSTGKTELQDLLREAIKKAKEVSPRAVDDLIRCASEAAVAVAAVTDSAAILQAGASADQRQVDYRVPAPVEQKRQPSATHGPGDLSGELFGLAGPEAGPGKVRDVCQVGTPVASRFV